MKHRVRRRTAPRGLGRHSRTRHRQALAPHLGGKGTADRAAGPRRGAAPRGRAAGPPRRGRAFVANWKNPALGCSSFAGGRKQKRKMTHRQRADKCVGPAHPEVQELLAVGKNTLKEGFSPIPCHPVRVKFHQDQKVFKKPQNHVKMLLIQIPLSHEPTCFLNKTHRTPPEPLEVGPTMVGLAQKHPLLMRLGWACPNPWQATSVGISNWPTGAKKTPNKNHTKTQGVWGLE